ncbi:MAG: hypothetical protein GY941_29635, partial [Planctomycetes bacterium]|nr:hypothetical protein [Planctomycetota bacterium]
SGGYKLQTMDHIHLNNMQKISSWFIETAIGQYYERKGKEVYKKRPGDPEWLENYPDAVWIYDYIKIRGYIYTVPEIERNRTIARCRQAFGRYNLMNVTECFLRTDYKGEIYEYWVVKEWKTGLYTQAKFVIAKAAALNSERTIIHTSDQFIEIHEIDKEFSVVFPIENLRTLYGLTAWLFPENFKNSDLKDFEVIMPEKGKFEKIPWP